MSADDDKKTSKKKDDENGKDDAPQEPAREGKPLKDLDLSDKIKAAAARLKPLGTRIVIHRLEAKDRMGFSHDLSGERSHTGMVVAAGPGRRDKDGRQPLDVAVGDVVFFGTYTGAAIDLDGESFLVMDEEDVLVIIEEASS